ncbi:MAG: hypothetical protein ACO3F3_19165, partial [Gemmataceae bacterium]
TNEEARELKKTELQKKVIPDLDSVQVPKDQAKKALTKLEKADAALKGGDAVLGKRFFREALDEYPGLMLANKYHPDEFYSNSEMEKLKEIFYYYNEGVKNENEQMKAVFYLRAIEIDTEKAAIGWALNNLAYGCIVAKIKELRDPEAAIHYAHKACALTQWRYYAFIGTLAQCYSEAGDFSNAARVAEIYLKVCPKEKLPDSGEPPVNVKEMEFNLNRFKSGKPWQELKTDKSQK